MKISAYYNKENQALTIGTIGKVEEVVKEDNLAKLYNENGQLIGLNIFNYDFNYHGFVEYSDIDSQYLQLFTNPEPAFVYGEIVETTKHPKSDKLQIAKVDLGSETVQIVCGAANCAANNIAVVAQVGAVLPNSMNIIESKLINIDSNGMLCSTFELGFEKNEGIKLLASKSRELGTHVKRADLQ